MELVIFMNNYHNYVLIIEFVNILHDYHNVLHFVAHAIFTFVQNRFNH